SSARVVQRGALPALPRPPLGPPHEGGEWERMRRLEEEETGMKESSGTLRYRRSPAGLEVLLVHPSGNYNRGKPWSIPKGLPDPGEDLEAAARRETREETGLVAGPLESLRSIQYQKSGKRIHCF